RSPPKRCGGSQGPIAGGRAARAPRGLEAGRGAQCDVDRADVDPVRAGLDAGRVGTDVSHIQIDGPARPLRLSSALTPAHDHVDSGLRDESPVAVGLELLSGGVTNPQVSIPDIGIARPN